MKFPKLYNPFKVADGDRTFSSFTLSVALLFLVFYILSVGVTYAIEKPELIMPALLAVCCLRIVYAMFKGK